MFYKCRLKLNLWIMDCYVFSNHSHQKKKSFHYRKMCLGKCGLLKMHFLQMFVLNNIILTRASESIDRASLMNAAGRIFVDHFPFGRLFLSVGLLLSSFYLFCVISPQFFPWQCRITLLFKCFVLVSDLFVPLSIDTWNLFKQICSDEQCPSP